MTLRIGVVMDPIQSIVTSKDSTFAMLLEAQARGWDILYMEPKDLSLRGDRAYARTRALRVRDDPASWFDLGPEETLPLECIPAVLMRKDPPFDIGYLYTTYVLEQAEHRGCLVVNRARSLRDANEKLFALHFADCAPPSLVASRREDLLAFLAEHGDIILKPLGSMGGASVFRVRLGDPNTNVIIETLTAHGRHLAMAQQYIPEIAEGDKRILLIEGAAIPYALARVPAGNLAAGGTGHGVPLSANDLRIAQRVGPRLREMGILFAGLDVIGEYLTEINITSPTCIRELDRLFGLNISAQLLDAIGNRIHP